MKKKKERNEFELIEEAALEELRKAQKRKVEVDSALHELPHVEVDDYVDHMIGEQTTPSKALPELEDKAH